MFESFFSLTFIGGMMASQRSPANLILPGGFNPGSRTPTPVQFQQGPRTPTANLMSPPGNFPSIYNHFEEYFSVSKYKDEKSW